MHVLTVDTATPHPALALAGGSSDLEVRLPGGRQVSEILLSALEELLAKAGLALPDVKRLAVCAGPGSFTGIRVGLATCWGLSKSLGIPIEAAGSLEAVAESARGSAGASVLCAFGAERGELYAARYDLSGPRAVETMAPRLIPASDFSESSGSGDLVVRLEDEPLSRPSPALALARAVARQPGPDATSLVARYVRLSAAEERKGATVK